MEIEQAKQEQYDELFQIMLEYSSDYLQNAVTRLNISTNQFKELFKTVGKVYVVYAQKEIAGFFWIEKREDVLHIHALIIKNEFQGKGLGRGILNLIQNEYNLGAKVLELGVHLSNNRAINLYENFGFVRIKQLDDIGFIIMQKHLEK